MNQNKRKANNRKKKETRNIYKILPIEGRNIEMKDLHFLFNSMFSISSKGDLNINYTDETKNMMSNSITKNLILEELFIAYTDWFLSNKKNSSHQVEIYIPDNCLISTTGRTFLSDFLCTVASHKTVSTIGCGYFSRYQSHEDVQLIKIKSELISKSRKKNAKRKPITFMINPYDLTVLHVIHNMSNINKSSSIYNTRININSAVFQNIDYSERLPLYLSKYNIPNVEYIFTELDYHRRKIQQQHFQKLLNCLENNTKKLVIKGRTYVKEKETNMLDDMGRIKKEYPEKSTMNLLNEINAVNFYSFINGNTQLEELILVKMNLNDVDVFSLIEGLRSCYSLKILSIESNGISNTMIGELLNIVEKTKEGKEGMALGMLQELSFDIELVETFSKSNTIHNVDYIWEAIVSIIANNKRIKKLIVGETLTLGYEEKLLYPHLNRHVYELKNQAFDDVESLEDLFPALKQSQSNVVKKINYALILNTSLEELQIPKPIYCCYKQSEIFSKVLKFNSKLKKLNIECEDINFSEYKLEIEKYKRLRQSIFYNRGQKQIETVQANWNNKRVELITEKTLIIEENINSDFPLLNQYEWEEEGIIKDLEYERISNRFYGKSKLGQRRLNRIVNI
mmetsp:Transcript_3504/g.3531  ORF Transcript_3504/g.3531 Transcript_3504/m.3531 type:complete len:625 (+) Transcript_3504:1-1875(+)